jgi:hypothetical protein
MKSLHSFPNRYSVKTVLLVVSVIFSLASLSRAGEERKVAFRTLCLEQIGGIEKVVMPNADGGKGTEIPLYTDISPVVQGVFKSNEAAFYIEKTGPDGKPVLELVGKAPIGKSDRQLFLFLPGEKGEGKPAYQVRSFDDDTGTFGMGVIRAINLAPVPVRYVISGATTPEIPPGKYAQFPHSKQVNDYNMYPVVVEFRSATGEWIKGQSVSWKATNRRREIVLTLVDSRFKQPTVRMYTDFPPWMEPTPEGQQP